MYLDSYGEVAPSYSSDSQALEPALTESPDTASTEADSTAHVTVRVPADAKVWFEETKPSSPGSLRELYLISDSDDYRTRTSLQLPATAPGRQVQHLVRRL